MKYILPVAACLLVMSVCSCKKQCGDIVDRNTPACIKNIITSLQNQPVRNPAATVYEYTYQNQKVYYITADCCDQYNLLYNSNCNIICAPDGGIAGHGDRACEGFFTARTDERLVWRDPR